MKLQHALSNVTIAGLPILAVIGDMHADATSSAPELAAGVTANQDLPTCGGARQGPASNPRQEGVAEDVMTRVSALLLLGLLMAVGALAPAPAAANPACNALIAGHVTLTANMDCTASATHGLRLSANATLNCAGFAITGPDGAQSNGASTGHYGLRASNVGGIAIEHCNVTGYERGLYFSSVHDAFVNDGNFYGNTRYGANVVGPDSYGLLFDANTYHSNGDEGIHISGPMSNGLSVLS